MTRVYSLTTAFSLLTLFHVFSLKDLLITFFSIGRRLRRGKWLPLRWDEPVIMVEAGVSSRIRRLLHQKSWRKSVCNRPDRIILVLYILSRYDNISIVYSAQI
ncbi:hypothetical protein CEXT_653001 [Caerostris extrusa]|uniref:Secreted protein n=1 Tax=Caerostris extrusa TaxID=172846 RepID=A0AAV4RY30_CAEEX|nr:hypothetical protein CEXT_653001 [Caerostris extrusa]